MLCCLLPAFCFVGFVMLLLHKHEHAVLSAMLEQKGEEVKSGPLNAEIY